jgi:thiosulfate reductase/polysulfide reductase chain A
MSLVVPRRSFLKISAAALAAAGLGAPQARLGAGEVAAAGAVRTVPTFCDICFWKCGAIASVRDGALWKIEGNPLDPLCHGRLCPRGTGGIGASRDPDRLTRPLLRAKVRGGEEWNAVSWDDALGHVAEKMQAIKAKHGPEAVALFSHGIGGTFLKHTLKAFGSPNLAAPSFAQCRGPRDVGFRLTFGDDPGSPERTDIANARCLVLIGSHLGENMHNTQVQEFAQAMAAGCTLIVADPRQSTAAAKAKWWLPVRPGSDTALVLAWMQVLVAEQLYDTAYVAKYGHGFAQFAAAIADKTPEWAGPLTGIQPEVIRETARAMARFRPATLVHPGRHSNWYGSDAQRSRAIALLNALLGSWGRQGGFYQPSAMELPAYPYPAYPKPGKPKADNPGKRHPFAHEAITTGIRAATLTGNPYPVKGWLVYATNLLHALPNEAETIQAIQQLDLLAVCDVIPSETAGWADVVLPECTYLERHDELNPELFREPFLALRQPVVPPPDEQKPNWWIARELALKLGLGAWYPWSDIEQYLAKRCELGGYDWERLKRDGIIRGQPQPLYFEQGAPAEFATPSGKIEFWSQQLADKGFAPVPEFEPPQPNPPGSYRVLFGRAPMHSFSRTQTNPLLHEVMPENALWLNAVEARRLGLKSGDRVRLRNQDGVLSDALPVKATERIRPDCVYLVHGFGHTAKGLKRAYRKGASDAQILTRYQTDPLMGGTALGNNFVTLEAV